MAQDIIDRKFGILFDWFDHTNDGWLTRDDFQQMADLFTAVAPPDDKENKNAMHEAFFRWWNLLLDSGAADAEQRVGRPQFLAVMRSHVTHPDHFKNVVLPIADALMSTLDANGSGTLTVDEYVRMYDALGIPSATSTPAFHRLDRDHDGVISHAEFRTAIEEFYLSSDPEAAGHHLLGSPLESE